LYYVITFSSDIYADIGGHVTSVGERNGVHGVLVGESEGRRPLGRPRRRWEDLKWIVKK
jgi:hypothetical protein